MSRQEDFKRMAHSHDTESSKYEQQFYIDGAEDGYEYAVDKACEWLKTNAYDYTRFEYLPESDYPQADVDVCKMVKDLRKAMDE